LQIGLLGFDINRHTALIMDGGNRAFSVTSLSQIGNAVVAVLSRPGQNINQVIYVHSFTATQNQILANLEEATGRAWETTHCTAADAVTKGLELFKKGEFSGLLLLLNAISLGEGYGSNHLVDAALANRELGLPEQPMHQIIAATTRGLSR
jgi:uncharacterized protein YbjT (DUF2867 family)